MSQPGDCHWCTRLGLPILPLRLAYVPKSRPRNTGVSEALTMTNASVATPLEAGQYLPRVITEGYVYTYDTRHGGFWRCFAATPKGLFREYIIGQPPTQTPAFTCQREGHNLDASIINIEQPKQTEQVWVGYSRVWLTRKALKQLRANDTLWTGMMTEINPSSLVAGGDVSEKVGFRASDADALNHAIPEYGFADFAQYYYAWTLNPAVNRDKVAQSLVERMQQISPQGGVVVGLNDPVGNARDAAAWRQHQGWRTGTFQKRSVRSRARRHPGTDRRRAPEYASQWSG